MNALNCMLKIARVVNFVMCILSDSQNSTLETTTPSRFFPYRHTHTLIMIL